MEYIIDFDKNDDLVGALFYSNSGKVEVTNKSFREYESLMNQNANYLYSSVEEVLNCIDCKKGDYEGYIGDDFKHFYHDNKKKHSFDNEINKLYYDLDNYKLYKYNSTTEEYEESSKPYVKKHKLHASILGYYTDNKIGKNKSNIIINADKLDDLTDVDDLAKKNNLINEYVHILLYSQFKKECEDRVSSSENNIIKISNEFTDYETRITEQDTQINEQSTHIDDLNTKFKKIKEKLS